jgi:precorrin-2 dehydrogenase / sirohydrochlorin ferrochelatase
MTYYPIHLDIKDRQCLVVGGGEVGQRKTLGLLDCGARVTVVSPKATAKLMQLAEENRIQCRLRPYETEDLTGVFLVIGATDDETLNRRVHADADARNILCNIADRPAICNFILPSVIRRGDLVITVSTSGKSPAFAKRLRRSLETQFGPAYGPFLTLMGNLRQRLLAEAHAPEAHKPLFEALLKEDLLSLVAASDIARIDALLYKILGEGYTYEALMKGER